jgi:hypothetical protein
VWQEIQIRIPRQPRRGCVVHVMNMNIIIVVVVIIHFHIKYNRVRVATCQTCAAGVLVVVVRM